MGIHFAHPSFVNIINNLSPDEALLIPEIERIPFIDLHLDKDTTFNIIYEFLTGLENKINLSFPKNIAIYLSNFEGLGLIKIHKDLWLEPPTLWEELEKFYGSEIEKVTMNAEELNNAHELENVYRLNIHKGVIQATPFGELFKKACLSNSKE